MSKDNSPIPYTCPLVDEVQDFIRNAHELLHAGRISTLKSVEFRNKFKDAIYLLEDLRMLNAALRAWGNSMYQNERVDIDWSALNSFKKEN